MGLATTWSRIKGPGIFKKARVITKSDVTTYAADPIKSLLVLTVGDVTYIGLDGVSVTITIPATGFPLLIQVPMIQVMSTGTTVTNMVGYF
jgi:hypothetical protein